MHQCVKGALGEVPFNASLELVSAYVACKMHACVDVLCRSDLRIMDAR